MPHEVERSNWHFPRLTHLEIRDLYSRLFLEDGSQERGVVNAEFFLQPIALPKLSSLAFTWSHPYLSPLIRRLVPQLHRLYLRRTPSSDDDDDDDLPFPEFPRHIFEHLTSLQHLSLDLKYDDDIFALADVPSSLLTLRLDGRRELTDVQLLERKYACLENLKELHLRSTPLVGKWWQLETEKLMRDRGTVVKEFEFQPHKPSKAVALWVEAVDEYE